MATEIGRTKIRLKAVTVDRLAGEPWVVELSEDDQDVEVVDTAVVIGHNSALVSVVLSRRGRLGTSSSDARRCGS